MSTSNITTFSMTSTQLVNAAARKLAVLGDGDAPTATQMANGVEAMNAMLKTFTTKGMPLWVMSEYAVTPTASRSYTMGVGTAINIPAPVKVTQVILRDNISGSTIPMSVKSHYDFNLLSGASSAGVPITYWYEPLNQTGVLHVWPSPDNYTIANRSFVMTYQRPFQDMVGPNDTLDFPQWWHEAIIYGLASRLAPEFGVPLQDRTTLKQEAKEFLDEALSFGTEEGSLFLQPDWTMR